MKWIWVWLLSVLPVSGATIVHPKLPEVTSAWVYVDIGSLQKEDVIVYLSDNQKDNPPWFMALVFNVDAKDGSIIVERPIGSGAAIFEEVERNRIIGAARQAKEHAILMPTHPPEYARAYPAQGR
jgi:hypothetical protein